MNPKTTIYKDYKTRTRTTAHARELKIGTKKVIQRSACLSNHLTKFKRINKVNKPWPSPIRNLTKIIKAVTLVVICEMYFRSAAAVYLLSTTSTLRKLQTPKYSDSDQIIIS